jgi:anti-sigma factor RsiW
MNENRNVPHSNDATTTRGCEHADELVTHLYGESTREEARVFRGHLEACAVCREELAAFGGVRERLGEWHAEALGTIPSLDINEALAPVTASRRPTERKRSAAVALREFFSLSPLWLRAGAVAAMLAVCALAALTLMRTEVRWDSNGLAFRTGIAERVVVEQVKVPVQTGYTDEQLNAVVAQRVAEAETRLKEQQPEKVINVSEGDARNAAPPVNATTQRRKRVARPGTRRVEPLLADDNLPRLSDLLSGSY